MRSLSFMRVIRRFQRLQNYLIDFDPTLWSSIILSYAHEEGGDEVALEVIIPSQMVIMASCVERGEPVVTVSSPSGKSVQVDLSSILIRWGAGEVTSELWQKVVLNLLMYSGSELLDTLVTTVD